MNENFSKEIVQLTADHLQQLFNLPALEKSGLDEGSAHLKKLHLLLSGAIEFLINTNLERLFNILYRIDVDDREIDELLGKAAAPKETAAQMAWAIIERELKKVESQKRFK